MPPFFQTVPENRIINVIRPCVINAAHFSGYRLPDQWLIKHGNPKFNSQSPYIHPPRQVVLGGFTNFQNVPSLDGTIHPTTSIVPPQYLTTNNEFVTRKDIQINSSGLYWQQKGDNHDKLDFRQVSVCNIFNVLCVKLLVSMLIFILC